MRKDSYWTNATCIQKGGADLGSEPCRGVVGKVLALANKVGLIKEAAVCGGVGRAEGRKVVQCVRKAKHAGKMLGSHSDAEVKKPLQVPSAHPALCGK